LERNNKKQYCLATQNDGSIWAWGNNTSGELDKYYQKNIPTRVGLDKNWFSISTNSQTSNPEFIVSKKLMVHLGCQVTIHNFNLLTV
jgi:alpha-tubulin suppressor-like RCC1 family protein